MKKLAAVCVLVAVCATMMWAAEEDRTKVLSRVEASQKVLDEIMAAPDKGIPEEILGAADCVAVVPSMINAGFVFGGRYGKGVSTCRTTDNHWSAPAPIRIEGGSWGLQIGGQAVDLVMLIMNKQGMQNLLESKFRIGADASAAAGPVGRHVEGSTDWKMRAQVLTYSRSRGAFAGITLNGAVLKQDTDDTVALYGKDVSFKNVLTGKVPPPPGTQTFLADVSKYFREARADEHAEKVANQTGTSGGTAGVATAPSRNQDATATETGSGAIGTAQTGTTSSTSQNPSSATTTESTQSSTSQRSGATTTETTPQSGTGTAATSSDQVQHNIQNALRNTSGLSTQNVSVRVTSDTVILSGSVPNQQDKATIRRIAVENSGGRQVDDSGLIVK